jgi:hypothetical protein
MSSVLHLSCLDCDSDAPKGLFDFVAWKRRQLRQNRLPSNRAHETVGGCSDTDRRYPDTQAGAAHTASSSSSVKGHSTSNLVAAVNAARAVVKVPSR